MKNISGPKEKIEELNPKLKEECGVLELVATKMHLH